MEFKNINYKRALPECENGDSFISCNISQLVLRDICAGKTGLTFTDCNLVNCNLPGDSEVVNCNTAKTDYCAWIHPFFGLETEPEVCRHVIPELVEEIQVDEKESIFLYDNARKDTAL